MYLDCDLTSASGFHSLAYLTPQTSLMHVPLYLAMAPQPRQACGMMSFITIFTARELVNSARCSEKAAQKLLIPVEDDRDTTTGPKQ